MEENPTVTGEFTARYTIERELGRGGAAVVYLARDNRQERHVALKVLHKELAQAIGAQRFLREIKHSSALQHPHLLTILDSGESRGTLYFVMPYMPDGSLRTRIAREKQLPIDDALRITKDVGEALAYAHSKGIVHRDIKPDNVLFSADHACLADFGIARAVDSVAADTLTSTGLVVGTPAYMSPEQASGEKTVDARSDQYSLGCLLYEMITGLPPFIGATQQSVISQRFTQPPPSMRAHRPTVPDHVERAVKRALAVVPADRFASVTEFLAALHDPSAAAGPVSVHRIRRRWFAVGAAAAIVTVAVIAAKPGVDWVRGLGAPQADTSKFMVLPLLSGADTIAGARVAAALRTELDRWGGLTVERDQVVSEAVRERGPVSSLDEALAIARSVGAGRLVWGDVSHDGGRTTVKAELYDVGRRSPIRDTMLVSVTGPPPDSTLRRMVNALLVVSSFPRGFDDGQDGTNSYAAWQAYGRGVVHLTSGRFLAAREELARSVQSDPQFAVAHLWLAHASSVATPKARHEWTPLAERALVNRERLRSRDVVRAEGLLALGKSDYASACRIFRSLVRGDSLDPHAWLALGQCLVSDSQLIRDGRSPSGWRFRSSLHEAGNGLLRALELEPRLHSPEVFALLQSVFMTSLNRLRSGLHVAGDSVWMYAYPAASADTLAFIPYSAETTARGGARADPLAHSRIVDRNRAIMLRAAQSWVSVYPRSADAFEALAGVLETRAQLTGRDPNTSALASVERARSLASAPKATPLAGIHVRLLVKTEQFSAARALADSVLQRLRGSEEFPEVKGALSALTGRPRDMMDGVVAQLFSDLQNLEAPLVRAAAEFLTYSALGACSSVGEAEKRVESLMASYVAPGAMSSVRRRLTTDALSLSASCSGGKPALRVERPAPLIVRMQQGLARGDTAAVRAGFDSLARMRRGARASQTAPDHLLREAWLRAAIGDTGAAAQRLDGVLNALPTLSATTLDNAVQAGSLVRAMALRAELARGMRESAAARRWGLAVAELWAGGDPVLRPTVQRMQNLAR